MARGTLSAQTVVRSGIVPSLTAGSSANGHQVQWHKRMFLHVMNGGGGSITVTIPTSATVDGLAAADREVTVGAGAQKYIGPFDENYVQSNGMVYVDLSSDTSVTLGAFKI